MNNRLTNTIQLNETEADLPETLVNYNKTEEILPKHQGYFQKAINTYVKGLNNDGIKILKCLI